MRIGELARRAGIGVQAVRYYERVHLLNAPKRTASGYRRYEFEDLERVTFIRRTQEWGFSLEEIRKLAEAHSALLHRPAAEQAGTPQLQFIIGMFEAKRHGIAEEIHRLQRLEEQLRQGIDSLMDRSPRCPATMPKASAAECPHHKFRTPASSAP